MNIRPGIVLASLSDIGCQREENEDSFCHAEPESDEEFLKRGRLVAVADGMGGYEGGQIASSLAVNTLRDVFLNSQAGNSSDMLLEAFESAHTAIKDHSRGNPELKGMGTTCTAAVLHDGQLLYGHVGDSRLYLLRNSAIIRLTRDHSRVQQMVDAGLISAEDANTHPSKNILTSALGSDSTVQADFSEVPILLQQGDVFLLCTDGLHGLVSEAEFLEVSSQNPPDKACWKLVEMAKARGGHDNITVQILRIEDSPAV